MGSPRKVKEMGSAWEHATTSAIFILLAVGVGWFAKKDWETLRGLRYQKDIGAFNFLVFGFLVFGVFFFLALQYGNGAYIRFTHNKVVETITLTTAEEVPWIGGNHYTDVTCQEYPGKVFRSSGLKGWSAGDKVNITFYMKGEEQIRYDL